MTPEPISAYPEAQFQKALVALIREILAIDKQQFIVVGSFGLDVVAFVRGSVRLFEVKSFGGQRSGSVGFGNAKASDRKSIC